MEVESPGRFQITQDENPRASLPRLAKRCLKGVFLQCCSGVVKAGARAQLERHSGESKAPQAKSLAKGKIYK